MTAKEVYCEVTVVDNESHEDTITKQISEAKDQKKTSSIWTYFEIDSSENNKKLFVLLVRRKFHWEEVSQLNVIPATFVSL